MKLTYTERNGVMYPDLALPEQTSHPIGKYGMMRLDYLKNYRRGTYTTLLTSGTLNQHLYNTEQEAKRQIKSRPLPLGKRARRYRRTQNYKPSPVGSRNEQRQTRCRRNRDKRNNFPLMNKPRYGRIVLIPRLLL